MLLLLENSTPAGQVALAHNGELIGTLPIPPRRRHNVDLMVAVDELCKQQQVTPADLTGVALTLGPGSFTGLRVAVATAKMLALTSPRPDFAVVGVPNLDLLHRQHPDALIALNVKRGTAWSVGPDRLHLPPDLRPTEQLQALADEHQLPLFAETLDDAIPPTIQLDTLLELTNQRLATSGGGDDPLTLAPAYIREPEAVTLWNEKEARAGDPP